MGILSDNPMFPILLSLDLDASRTFYHDVLGLDILREDAGAQHHNVELAHRLLQSGVTSHDPTSNAMPDEIMTLPCRIVRRDP